MNKLFKISYVVLFLVSLGLISQGYAGDQGLDQANNNDLRERECSLSEVGQGDVQVLDQDNNDGEHEDRLHELQTLLSQLQQEGETALQVIEEQQEENKQRQAELKNKISQLKEEAQRVQGWANFHDDLSAQAQLTALKLVIENSKTSDLDKILETTKEITKLQDQWFSLKEEYRKLDERGGLTIIKLLEEAVDLKAEVKFLESDDRQKADEYRLTLQSEVNALKNSQISKGANKAQAEEEKT